MKNKCQILILFFSLLFLKGIAHGQQLKSWDNIGLSVSPSKKLNISVGQTYGFNFSPARLSFIQSGLSINYRIEKKIKVSGYYRHSLGFRSNGEKSHKFRIGGLVSLRKKREKNSISNSLLLEYHGKNETKYRARLIYVFRIQTKSEHFIKSIKLKPFFSTALFYNIGGNPIKIYDDRGNYLGKFVPFGFHRIRLTTGVSYSPIKFVKVSFQLMRQQEFNTDFAKTNRMNNYDWDKDKIRRPFSNYWMMGIGLKFYIKHKNNPIKNYIPNRYWETNY